MLRRQLDEENLVVGGCIGPGWRTRSNQGVPGARGGAPVRGEAEALMEQRLPLQGVCDD